MAKKVPEAPRYGSADLDKELAVIEACWGHLNNLPSEARSRVLFWLRDWSEDQGRVSQSK